MAELVHLRELKIGGFPDDSLEALADLDELRYLCIVDLPAVRSLEPLRGLARLETLGRRDRADLARYGITAKKSFGATVSCRGAARYMASVSPVYVVRA